MAVYFRDHRNLFDISKAEPESSGTIINIANNSVEFNASSLYIPLIAGQRYVLSFKRNKNANIYLRNGKTGSGYFAIINPEDTSAVIAIHYTGDGINYLTMSTFASGLILSDIQIKKAVEEPQPVNIHIRDRRNFVQPYESNFDRESGEAWGITWLVNPDKSIVLNGTATRDVNFEFKYLKETKLPKGTYKFTGMSFIELYHDGNYLKGIYTSETPIINIDYSNFENITCFIQVRSGTTVTNAVYRPRIERVGGVRAYIKSDKNLFDISKVNGLVNPGGVNFNKYFVKDGDRINVKYGAYAQYTYLTGNEVYLEQGTYAFSTDVYLEPNQWSTREAVYMSIRNFERKQHITALHEIVYADIVTRVERTFTVENAGIYRFGLFASGGASHYTNIPIWFSNIQFEKDNTATPYTPYGYQKIK